MAGLITHYGLALVFANVLIQQLGLPIPAAPTLIVAGALAAVGNSSALAIFGVACAACSISDAAWYTTGRLYGRRVTKLLRRIPACVSLNRYSSVGAGSRWSWRNSSRVYRRLR